jgi:hypothetical protein
LGIEAAVNALLWLDQLQAIDQAEVGAQLIALNQLDQSGYPGENGFIVPDGAIWQQTDWHNEILQDFSSLNLSAFRAQTAQMQSIAQSLQQGILALALGRYTAAGAGSMAIAIRPVVRLSLDIFSRTVRRILNGWPN